jgi:hypothetical protein
MGTNWTKIAFCDRALSRFAIDEPPAACTLMMSLITTATYKTTDSFIK